MPDTIILNDGNPMWIYSSTEGYVYRTETFIDQHIFSKLGDSENKEDLVAVLKRGNFNNKTNHRGLNTVALSTNDLIKHMGQLQQDRCVIQKFVKCNGPKAFVCRVVYKRDVRPECWIITNKHSFNNENIDINQRVCTAIAVKDSCSAVYAKTGK